MNEEFAGVAFRHLDAAEVEKFRQAARDSGDWKGGVTNELYHPVYRHECARMALEELGRMVVRTSKG